MCLMVRMTNHGNLWRFLLCFLDRYDICVRNHRHSGPVLSQSLLQATTLRSYEGGPGPSCAQFVLHSFSQQQLLVYQGSRDLSFLAFCTLLRSCVFCSIPLTLSLSCPLHSLWSAHPCSLRGLRSAFPCIHCSFRQEFDQVLKEELAQANERKMEFLRNHVPGMRDRLCLVMNALLRDVPCQTATGRVGQWLVRASLLLTGPWASQAPNPQFNQHVPGPAQTPTPLIYLEALGQPGLPAPHFCWPDPSLLSAGPWRLRHARPYGIVSAARAGPCCTSLDRVA